MTGADIIMAVVGLFPIVGTAALIIVDPADKRHARTHPNHSHQETAS